MSEQSCPHLDEAIGRPHGARPSAQGCEDCLASGGVWVHLRLCLACGHVGCCDNSPNRHATHHHHTSRHPVIRSYEPGENWAYCYVDESFADPVPAMPGEAAPTHYAPPGR